MNYSYGSYGTINHLYNICFLYSTRVKACEDLPRALSGLLVSRRTSKDGNWEPGRRVWPNKNCSGTGLGQHFLSPQKKTALRDRLKRDWAKSGMGLGCTAGPALDRNRPSISSVQMMTREKMAIRKVILDRSFSASSSHHRNFSVSSSYHWSFFFFNPPSRFSSSSSSSSSQIYGVIYYPLN